MSTILIKGGRVIDPASNLDGVADVLLRDGRVAKVGRVSEKADKTIDASGKIVTPGLIDMHVHLREPGDEEVETIASGAAAAVAGGFTTVAAMPNTDPAADNEAMVEFVAARGRRAGMANVLAIGTVSKGRKGEELAEIGMMVRGGAVAFSDDGSPVQNSLLMRRAMEYVKMFDRCVISHAEDATLAPGWIVNEGLTSVMLGLAGTPAASEEIAVARDCILAGLTGAHLHVAHVSTAGAVEAIRRAKARGVRVTAEATPHHLTLTDERLKEETVLASGEKVKSYNPNYKMNPPLRSQADVEALREGLRDGTIDCIASDHAPHSSLRSEVEFMEAAFGVIGLETTLPVVITELIGKGLLSWPDAVARMTVNPARVLRLAKGTLAIGADADVTVIDPGVAWTIDASRFRSKSRNTPFEGWKVKGRATCVIVGGEVKL